jgi:hypothetical protein
MIRRMMQLNVRPPERISAVENTIAAGTVVRGVCPHDALRLAGVPVQLLRTQSYDAPRITYVDDDAATIPRVALTAERARELLAQDDPTTKMPALSKRTTTLNPVMADGDATREVSVRRFGWFFLLVVLACIAVAVVRFTRVQSFILGMAHERAPSTEGELLGPESRAGETVFVDDHALGTVPAPITVTCGVRHVRIGKSGTVRAVDVPCGGRVTL